MKNQTKSFLTTCVLLFMIIMLNGCASSNSFFKFNEGQNPPIIPDTIVVISGFSDEFNKYFVNKLTEELGKTKFKVITQDQITMMFKEYPFDLINFKCEDKKFDKPYISDETKKIVDGMQSRLKTNYILLAWIEDITIVSDQYGKRLQMKFFTRLIKYPESKVVGYSFLHYYQSLGLFGQDSRSKAAKELIGYISKNIVAEMIKKGQIQ